MVGLHPPIRPDFTPPAMIQVLLADDHPLVRSGLRTILESEPDLEVCAEAADYGELIQRVSATTDVIVTDFSMPGVGFKQAMSQVSERFPQIPVVLISMCEEAELRAATQGLGAIGVLDKFNAATELAIAIRTVVARHAYPRAADPLEESSKA